MTWRAYVPNTIGIFRQGGFSANEPVLRVIAHPAGKHTGPIVADMVAVEIVTARGSRWYGVDRAYIDSSLRMVVERKENRDEVLATWEAVT